MKIIDYLIIIIIIIKYTKMECIGCDRLTTGSESPSAGEDQGCENFCEDCDPAKLFEEMKKDPPKICSVCQEDHTITCSCLDCQANYKLEVLPEFCDCEKCSQNREAAVKLRCKNADLNSFSHYGNICDDCLDMSFVMARERNQ